MRKHIQGTMVQLREGFAGHHYTLEQYRAYRKELLKLSIKADEGKLCLDESWY
ncbi:hypothetical protein [Vibrio gallicus]|uniref:hypothetical protein n=1 Tax=Vibrio gallicus TaxID=190897 RepID=UPI0021C2DD22|nr:hypothetical protein [Vibrio gallicus]